MVGPSLQQSLKEVASRVASTFKKTRNATKMDVSGPESDQKENETKGFQWISANSIDFEAFAPPRTSSSTKKNQSPSCEA